MEQLILMFSFLLISSVIMAILSSNPIHSVFWLVIVFLQSAGFLITLGFEFIALMMIIIYVGAIAILFLFVIMMLDVSQLKTLTPLNHLLPVVFLVAIVILIEAWWVVKHDNFKPYIELFQWDLEAASHIHSLSCVLYIEYAFPLFVISLLLLIAMVGAIVLTLELGVITRKQTLTSQHHRNNSWI